MTVTEFKTTLFNAGAVVTPELVAAFILANSGEAVERRRIRITKKHNYKFKNS